MKQSDNDGYQTPEFQNKITLQLSRNESTCAISNLEDRLADLDQALFSNYPAHQELQNQLGKYCDVPADRIVVTAGGDDGIDRIIRHAIQGSAKTIVTHAPSFEMVDIYCRNHGGSMSPIPWLEGDFPVKQFVDQIDQDTALVVLTSPNNPTGGIISIEAIEEINQAARKVGAKLLIDHAYIEFADQNPIAQLTVDDNIIIIRTFSKAWGLAGLRVGYLIAPSVEFANTMRNSSGPFPVSAVSLELARLSLVEFQNSMDHNVAQIKKFRKLLIDLVTQCGGTAIETQGNFVLVKFKNADVIWNGLAEDGVGVRIFTGNVYLENQLRITCPTCPADYLQLAQSLCRLCDVDFESQKVAIGLVHTQDAEKTPSRDAHSETDRVWTSTRKTKETSIDLAINLDGSGVIEIETGIGFLDHMLTALAFHAGFDLQLKCDGDLHVDDHHTAEDCALALGTAIDNALGKRSGIKRFGYAYAPLDESLARTVIDLSGRPWPEIHLNLEREMIGTWACENITHFFQSFAMTLKCSLHVDVLRGSNDHHRAEAAFKSCAKALREALTQTSGEVPSTKGVL
ncbi:imidazoleglycerol-phosphate dehydratase HisB [Mariniblastus sp.]|nr:imidazoleglycerol-phosphate dehydratase HisB [Mariniblastus sp.]